MKKQIKKVFCLALLGNLLHLLYMLFKQVIGDNSGSGLLDKIFNPSSIVDFLLFNQPAWRTSLWYINALLYVLIVIYLFQRKNKNLNRLYPLIPISLICNLLFGTYSRLLFVNTVPLCYSRNFLFCGMPCFLIGDFLYHHETKFVSLFGKKRLVSLFLVLSYVELWLLTRFKIISHVDLLLTTMLLAVSLFCVFLNAEKQFKGNFLVTVGELGRKHSFSIYIIHSIVIEVFYKLLAKIDAWVPFLSNSLEWIGPFVVLAVTTLFAIVINIMWSKRFFLSKEK